MSDTGYGEAMRELETILEEIEREDVDVDLLSSRVKRAAELIRLCRTRIEETQLEVEEIVAELDVRPAMAEPDHEEDSP